MLRSSAVPAATLAGILIESEVCPWPLGGMATAVVVCECVLRTPMPRTASLLSTGQSAEAVAERHFKNRGYRIMWRGDQSARGVAFVTANDSCAKYIEVRFAEGGLNTDAELPADDAPGEGLRGAFIDRHVRDTLPPCYAHDVAAVHTDRSAKLARVNVSEGEAVCVRP